MIEIRQLWPGHFRYLKTIFRDEFQSGLPLPQNSEIFAAFEDKKLVGFVLAENIKMVGQLYVAPHYRNNSIKIVAPLIRSMRDKYEGKEFVGTVASEPRFAKLYEKLGMERIDGEFWRRNI